MKYSLVLILLLTACTGLKSGTKPDKVIDTPVPPLKLEISSEQNDGENLYITGELLCVAAKCDLSQCLAKLYGKSLEEDRIQLLPCGKGFINKDETINLSLRIQSKDITDYEVTLLWGQKGRDALAAAIKDRLTINIPVYNAGKISIKIQNLNEFDVAFQKLELVISAKNNALSSAVTAINLPEKVILKNGQEKEFEFNVGEEVSDSVYDFQVLVKDLRLE